MSEWFNAVSNAVSVSDSQIKTDQSIMRKQLQFCTAQLLSKTLKSLPA